MNVGNFFCNCNGLPPLLYTGSGEYLFKNLVISLRQFVVEI
jgi:hypothetical protein